MRAIRIATALFLAPALLQAPPVRAQDVQYETMTRLNFPGAMGTMMRAAAKLGGGSLDVVEKTYIKGARMRTDLDETSTIMDLEGKRFISLDHDRKTYTAMTFEQLAGQAQAAAAQLKDERSKAGQQGGETQVKFRFSVDATDQREKVSGYDATRHFLTMEMESKYTPEGQTQQEEGGTLVLLTDLWAAKDVPTMQPLKAFEGESAKEMANAQAGITKAIALAFADEPNVEVAFEQSVKEAQKIQGTPLRTTVYFVAVAPEKKFARELATAEKPKSGGVLKAAGKGVLGGLAGRLGKKQEEPAQAEEATQGTILTVTTETRNISTKPVDPKLFEIPAGYKEVKFEDIMKAAK
jgi:hypothetical protein